MNCLPLLASSSREVKPTLIWFASLRRSAPT
jgi:hypothetical protein